MKTIIKISNAVGMIVVFILMLLGSADVLGRYLFNKPIAGAMETSEMLLGLLVFFSWAGIQATEGHARMDLFISRFPIRAQVAAEVLNTLLTFILFALIAWQAAVIAKYYHDVGRLVYVVEWPLAFFHLLLSVGALIVCPVLIMRLIRLLRKKGSSLN